MYYKLTCKVSIGNYVLRGVHAIEIKKSVHQLIQTAKVSMPLSVVFRNKEMNSLERIKLAEKIKEGDAVKLEIGYDGNNRTEFEGYIKRINYKLPLEIECEDPLYLLRKVYFKESFRNISAKDLLQKVLDKLKVSTGVKIKLYEKCPDVVIGNFYPKGENGVWILEELKKFGVTTYLTNVKGVTTLFAGLIYTEIKSNVKYKFNSNTISTDDLKYQLNDDKKYRVTVVNFKRDGTQHRETFGEEGGDSITVNIYNATSKEQMQLKAKAEVNRLKVTGYKGNIETFLVPYCEPGMIAATEDPQFPERAGEYYIGTVTTTFGTDGARRKPELEIRTK